MTCLKQDLPKVLSLKTNGRELLDLGFFPGLLLDLSLLGESLDRRTICQVVSWWRVVVLVEVYLAKQQDIFAADHKDAHVKVGVEPAG